MKALHIIILLLIVLLTAGFGSYYYLDQSSSNLLDLVQEIEKPLSQQDWQQAEKATEVFLEKWKKQKEIWLLIIDHQEIDSIEESISKVKAYIENKNKPLAQGELVSIKQLVQHVPIKEELNLKNIL